jgi:hypothetical protein
MANYYLITIFVVLLASAKAADKAQSLHNIYVTKEEELQGKFDWLVKDSGGLGRDV